MNQGKITILLVDKPGYLRNALHSLISSNQAWSRVETADTGLLALKKIAEIQPALVLIGHKLPLPQIAELTGQIKQTWPGIICLALSEIDYQTAPPAGVDKVLESSMPRAQILAIIQAALQEPDKRGENNPASGLKEG